MNKARSIPIKRQNRDVYLNLAFWILPLLIAGGTLLLNRKGYDLYGLPKVTSIHVLLAAALLLWFFHLSQEKSSGLLHTCLDLPIVLWFGALALSTYFSIDITNSIYGEYERYQGFLTQVSYVIVFILAVNLIRTDKQVDIINLTVVATASLVSVYAIAQHYSLDFIDWSKIENGTVPVISTLGNSNFLADFLALLLPIIMTLSFTMSRWRYYFLLSFALGYTALLFSYCRAGLVGFALACLVFFIPTGRLLWQKQRSQLLILISLIIIITLLVNFFGSIGSPQTPVLVKRMASSIEVGEGTVAQRLSIWKSSLAVLKKRPLTGWGLETFGLVFPRFQRLDYRRFTDVSRSTDKTHNEFLQIAVSGGMFSLLFFLWLLITFILKTEETIRSIPGSDDRGLLQLGYLSGIFSYFIAIQFSFSITGVAFLFWLVMGQSLASQGIIDRRPVIFYRLRQTAVILVLSIPFLISCFSGLMTGRNLRADIGLRQGIFASNAGLIDSAILSVKQATLLTPNRVVYRQFLVNMYIDQYYQTGDVTNLENAALEALMIVATSPSRSAGYLQLARTQLLLQLADKNIKLTSEIENNLKTAIKLEPFSAKAHLYLGQTYQLTGQRQLALRYYRKAHQLDKSIPPAQEVWSEQEKTLKRP